MFGYIVLVHNVVVHCCGGERVIGCCVVGVLGCWLCCWVLVVLVVGCVGCCVVLCVGWWVLGVGCWVLGCWLDVGVLVG